MDVDVIPLELDSGVQSAPMSDPIMSEVTKIHREPTLGVIQRPDGTIIIQELDTPTIRREKNLRRKAEKLRMATEGAHPQSAGPSRLSTANQNIEGDSDLSDLSDLESEAEKDRGLQPSGQPAPAGVSQNNLLPEILEGGTLVWAKADTYPWWPAVVFEEDDPSIPRVVLNQGRIKRRKRNVRLHLVQFFDKTSSWQWLEAPKLKALGEDKKQDEELLDPNSKLQRWKTAMLRHDCRMAFRRAVAEMETESDGVPGRVIGEGDEGAGVPVKTQ